MGPGFVYDESRWPLLIVHYPRHPSDADYTVYLSQGADYLQRRELYAIVFNMGGLSMPTAGQRQMQIEWMRVWQPLMRETVLGCAFVIHSPLVRLSLSAVLHVVPLPLPYVAVADVDAGVRWALERMEERGLHETAQRIRGASPSAPLGSTLPGQGDLQ